MKRGQAGRQCFPGWLKTLGSTANPGSSQPDTGLKVSPCCQPGIDTRQSGGVNTRDLGSLAVSFFIWFQSLHKIVHFDGLKRFIQLSRSGVSVVMWTNPKSRRRKSALEWHADDGIALVRGIPSADFYSAASSVLSAGSTTGCVCLWVAAHNLGFW